MSFWLDAPQDGQQLAIIDEHGDGVCYAELWARVAAMETQLQALGPRQLVFLLASNRLASIVIYLACLRLKHVLLLLPEDMPAARIAQLQAAYRPSALLGPQPLTEQALKLGEYDYFLTYTHETPPELHPDLALLLNTSGTTGSPRLVRLSARAVHANATSIANYLHLQASDRAITSLPMFYSYGLSVINSHLSSGATLVLNSDSVLQAQFWERVRQHQVTSLAGVPYIYQMLRRVGFEKMELPSLRTLTQAGGKLDNKLTALFCQLAAQKHWRFFVMYGQTEATARISFVPPERLHDKIGSIGLAIPGGQLSLDPDSGELIYQGENVMLGYAECAADLSLGDQLHGVLRTGDLGEHDAEGFFYVTGRLKRFIKLTGNRVNLDDIEQYLQQKLEIPVAVAGRDEKLCVWLETSQTDLSAQCSQLLQAEYRLHHTLHKIHCVDALPLLANGKKDYKTINDWLAQ